MANRKDLMRIIRSDDSFSAKLGFGGEGVSGPETRDAQGETQVPAVESVPAAPPPEGMLPEATPTSDHAVEPPHPSTDAAPGKRGVVIYVAVSLTPAQAIRAEHWAAAAACSVHLLMRRTAQAMRKDLFEHWAASGVDRVEERRGGRGRYPTSITLTLTPDLAAAFSTQLDPMGMIGLGRALGPAFRMRFEAAFDAALEKAGF